MLTKQLTSTHSVGTAMHPRRTDPSPQPALLGTSSRQRAQPRVPRGHCSGTGLSPAPGVGAAPAPRAAPGQGWQRRGPRCRRAPGTARRISASGRRYHTRSGTGCITKSILSPVPAAGHGGPCLLGVRAPPRAGSGRAAAHRGRVRPPSSAGLRLCGAAPLRAAHRPGCAPPAPASAGSRRRAAGGGARRGPGERLGAAATAAAAQGARRGLGTAARGGGGGRAPAAARARSPRRAGAERARPRPGGAAALGAAPGSGGLGTAGSVNESLLRFPSRVSAPPGACFNVECRVRYFRPSLPVPRMSRFASSPGHRRGGRPLPASSVAFCSARGAGGRGEGAGRECGAVRPWAQGAATPLRPPPRGSARSGRAARVGSRRRRNEYGAGGGSSGAVEVASPCTNTVGPPGLRRC